MRNEELSVDWRSSDAGVETLTETGVISSDSWRVYTLVSGMRLSSSTAGAGLVELMLLHPGSTIFGTGNLESLPTSTIPLCSGLVLRVRKIDNMATRLDPNTKEKAIRNLFVLFILADQWFEQHRAPTIVPTQQGLISVISPFVPNRVFGEVPK